MQIQTPYGPQQIDPNSLLTFPKGLPSFEDCTRFKLFHQEDPKAPGVIYWLQSLEQPDIMFSVADPCSMKVDYHFELSDEEMALLQADKADDLLILLLLYKSDSDLTNDLKPALNKNVNAALRAPLVINLRAQLGLQKSLYDADISVLVKGKPLA